MHPAFNISDFCAVSGGLLLLLLAMRGEVKRKTTWSLGFGEKSDPASLCLVTGYLRLGENSRLSFLDYNDACSPSGPSTSGRSLFPRSAGLCSPFPDMSMYTEYDWILGKAFLSLSKFAKHFLLERHGFYRLALLGRKVFPFAIEGPAHSAFQRTCPAFKSWVCMLE